MNAFEREEQGLEDEYNNGDISLAEYNRRMMELHRDYRQQAHEAGQAAYDEEMSRW